MSSGVVRILFNDEYTSIHFQYFILVIKIKNENDLFTRCFNNIHYTTIELNQKT